MGDRHNQIRKYQFFTNASMSGTSTITSTPPSNIQFLDDIGIQLNWSGSPVGNFQIQVSADYDPNEGIAGAWVPILFTYWNGASFITDINVPTTMGSPYYFDLTLLSAPYLQVVYTNTSGMGTLNGFITAKAL
jgi:hypothetical protein